VAGRARRARHASRRAADRHLLRPALAAAIVADADVRPNELVLDIGAGNGRLTQELARTGARVLAIELDPDDAATLRRRFASSDNITVVEGDALGAPLPRESFRVVANLPFGRTTAILRKLLDDPLVPLSRADVIVEWDVARKRAACWPSTLLGVCWAAWYELLVVRRVPRTCFEPPPSVDAAVLRVTPRRRPLVRVDDRAAFHAFVRAGFDRGLPRSRAARQCVRRLGLARGATARELDVYQWAALFAALQGGAEPANVERTS
jgi:23S rRNA (adenine-N6)-dimethyltransferase